MIYQIFPTDFAWSIGRKCSLLQKSYANTDRAQMMECFQKFAINGTFEEALVAFTEVDLSEEELEALKQIFKSTKPWVIGRVSGLLMGKLHSPKTSPRDAIEISQAISKLMHSANEKEISELISQG